MPSEAPSWGTPALHCAGAPEKPGTAADIELSDAQGSSSMVGVGNLTLLEWVRAQSYAEWIDTAIIACMEMMMWCSAYVSSITANKLIQIPIHIASNQVSPPDINGTSSKSLFDSGAVNFIGIYSVIIQIYCVVVCFLCVYSYSLPI